MLTAPTTTRLPRPGWSAKLQRFDMESAHVTVKPARPRSRSPSPEPLADEIPLHVPHPAPKTPVLHAPESVQTSPSASAHMYLLASLEDADFAGALRQLASGAIETARVNIAEARAEAVQAHDHNFVVADRDFVVERERAAVRAMLLRSSRAAARLHDAVEGLEAAETQFLADAGGLMRAACNTRLAEVRLLEQKLAYERKQSEDEIARLHAELDDACRRAANGDETVARLQERLVDARQQAQAEARAVRELTKVEYDGLERMWRLAAVDAEHHWTSFCASQNELRDTQNALSERDRQLAISMEDSRQLRAELAETRAARAADVAALTAALAATDVDLAASERTGRVRAYKLEIANEDLRRDGEEQVKALKQQAAESAHELNTEVDRLRKVQRDAVKLGASGGSGAPGGGGGGASVGGTLFFEAMKARDPKQKSSISWRGVNDGLIKGQKPPVEYEGLDRWRERAKSRRAKS